jgi:hypothetical protein
VRSLGLVTWKGTFRGPYHNPAGGPLRRRQATEGCAAPTLELWSESTERQKHPDARLGHTELTGTAPGIRRKRRWRTSGTPKAV